MQQAPRGSLVSPVQRARTWYGVLLVVFAVFTVRLFYLQVIRYDYYKQAALNSQLKEYEVQAPRGTISAHMGDGVVPLVLNQKLYTLYADPTLVEHPDVVASKLQGIIGGKGSDLTKLLTTKNTRYVVLQKKLSPDQSKRILAFKFPGVGTQEQDYRIYPQGAMASQLLGFVNDEGTGEYGVEQALNKVLKGIPGQLKAVTDVNGVPLAASSGNLSTAPVAGENVVLTLDMGMQAQMEQILAREEQSLKAKGLSAVIMDPNTGAIKAMANVPTYDPAHYREVSDPSVFQNAAVTNAIEPGSIMKTLTTSAALDQGVIQPDTTFYDPAHWLIDDFNITDIEEDGGPGEQSVASTLNLSLNTGATWMLMQMGGGQINQKARTTWYNYMVKHFLLGQETGIEQGYEAGGYVPGPQNNGAGINLTYANTAFGQALTATALQMSGALSSVVNGGTYYQPYLVDRTVSADGRTTITKPKVLENHVVSQQVGRELIPLMEYVVREHYLAGYPYLNFSSNYSVGGKTGTAQIAKPGGGYYDNEFNGTYMGFVGGDHPQYVIVVYTIQPQVNGYAGSMAGQPIFADLAHMLINNFGVTPKTH
jgi:cell division protein FtsI/penicillin-binding protein 2